MSDKQDKLLELAKSQFTRVCDAENESRENQLDDMRFRAASPDNHWQWPSAIRNQREADPSGQRPCLTINKIPQHVNQVTNDIRQNRPSMKVIPVDDKADPELAEMLNGLLRHIGNVSDADIAFDTAIDNAVTSGVGYIRVLTDYVRDDSFEQEILIRRIRNPFTVYMDPDITMPDGSDAQFCFITELIPKKEYEAEYGEGDEQCDWDMLGKGDSQGHWYQEGQIRVAEWFRVEYEKRTLSMWGNGAKTWDDEDPAKYGVAAPEQPLKTRQVQRRKIMWRKICGHRILDEQEWPGMYIPVARVVGNEFDIEGKLHVSGLVRNAKDAQRMYNYWASQEVEMLALAPKAPFVGASGQFEGFEDRWATANQINYAYLEYNPVVDTDNGPMQMPPPQRVQPPMPPAGFIQAKMGASDDIKSTTGQYDASLGAQGNETSGVAIMRRDHQSDVSTFHFVDNLSRAIRFVGRICVDLIPKIYDTKRIARILGEDGEPDQVVIDPSQPNAVTQVVDQEGQEIAKLYNPSIGQYDVVVTVGPSYTTKRQEAAEAMSQMTQANPQLWQVIGDLLVRNMDWPGADEMSKRLKAILLPQVQQAEGDDQQQIPPQVNQAMEMASQHIEQMQAQMAQLQQQLQEAQTKHDIEEAKLQIEEYRAQTDRMQALNAGMSPQEVAQLAAQLVMQAMHSPPPDQQMQQEPAPAGFFTPESGGMPQENQPYQSGN